MGVMMYAFTQLLGWFNILSAIIAGTVLLYLDRDKDANGAVFLFMLTMQVVVGAYLVYASKQKSRGSEIGHKMYPSSIVAFILYAAFAYRWFLFGE